MIFTSDQVESPRSTGIRNFRIVLIGLSAELYSQFMLLDLCAANGLEVGTPCAALPEKWQMASADRYKL
jgi:hypothetical protein